MHFFSLIFKFLDLQLFPIKSPKKHQSNLHMGRFKQIDKAVFLQQPTIRKFKEKKTFIINLIKIKVYFNDRFI